ncbi:MAG TPA: hypothetical protein VFI11_06600 [Anaerolineales bacterium]|nr:hypothetical protein [Anaerolineales bacterium]
MNIVTALTDVLAFIFGTIFSLWPLWMAIPLIRKKGSLLIFLILWLFLGFVRVLAAYAPTRGLRIIPEPANTLFFIAVGLVIGLMFIIRRASATEGAPRR